MNITSTAQQPPRSSFTCHRHPAELVTTFCSSCLVDRLNTLDTTTAIASYRPSSSAAYADKSLFSVTSRVSNYPAPLAPPPKPLNPSSFLPEFRRSKSFSASKHEALARSLEPHRRSCDVRAKNTLSSLFSLDDESKISGGNAICPIPAAAAAAASSNQSLQISSANPIEFNIINKPVSEEIETDEDFVDSPENLADIDALHDENDEIKPADDTHLQNTQNQVGINTNICKIVEEKRESLSNSKPMNHHIDLVAHDQAKKTSAGGFWAAASVFSNKWRKWRQNQKVKNQTTGKAPAGLKPIPRHRPETHSEIADYGFRRRSIDIDHRFSLDVPRISFDDPRYSFDEPRASLDSYFTGRNFPKIPPMPSSLLENRSPAMVPRADMHIPLEPPYLIRDEDVPGGSNQTRDYYLDTSSGRRKSLDRSNYIRKTAAAIVAEIDDLKMASSNAQILPTNTDYIHSTKLPIPSYTNPSRDDISQTLELSGLKETKKSHKWGWKILSFLNKKTHKYEDDKYSKHSSANGVERSSSQPWRESRIEGSNALSMNIPRRSNSSASWRHAAQLEPPFASGRRSSVDNNRRRSDFGVDKNRYHTSHLDNGLLRFYLTPTWGNRRGGMGPRTRIRSGGAW